MSETPLRRAIARRADGTASGTTGPPSTPSGPGLLARPRPAVRGLRHLEAWRPVVTRTVHTQPNPDGSIIVRTRDGGSSPPVVATYDAEGRLTMRGGWDASGRPTQETFAYFEDGGYSSTLYGDESNIVHLYDADDVMTGGYVWVHESGWGRTWSGSDQTGEESPGRG